MEDNRKLAVSFGTFACVIEGYDDPFSIMRKTVLYFERLAEENPGFAKFGDIVDYDDLVARLRDEEDADIDLEPIAGGVYIRKLDRAEDVDAAPEVFAETISDEPPLEEVDVSEEDLADLAALDAAPSDVSADDGMAEATEHAPMSDYADEPVDAISDEADYTPTEIELPHEDMDIADEGETPEAEDEAGAVTTSSAEAEGEGGHDDATVDSTEQGAEQADDSGMPETSPFQSTSGFGRPMHEPQDDDLAEVDDQEVAAEAAAFSASFGDNDGVDNAESDAHEARSEASDDDIAGDAGDDQPADSAPGALRLGEDDAVAPLRLGAAETSEPAAEGPAPMRLGETAPQASPDADDADDTAPAPKPLFLRRKPADDEEAPAEEDAAAPAKPAALGALRLGPELKPVPPANADTSGPSFIDTVAANDTPEQAGATSEAPNKSGDESGKETPKSGGLRLGGLLRRKTKDEGESPTDNDSAPESGKESAPVSEPDSKPAAPDSTDDTSAEKPKGGLLRVVPSAPEPETKSDATDADSAPQAEDPAPQPEAPAARGGFRSFLRSKPKEGPADTAAEESPAVSPASEPTPASLDSAPEPDSPAAEPTPEPEDVPKPAAKSSQPDQGSDVLRDRLHASFAKAPEPAAKTFDLDDDDDEAEVEVTTPRGFAKAAGASALHEVMAAAAGYLSLVEHRATMSRGEIVECTESITGGEPLTAQAKVMAFGKLTRNGDLVRIDGGLFMMSEEALLRYRQNLDGAA